MKLIPIIALIFISIVMVSISVVASYFSPPLSGEIRDLAVIAVGGIGLVCGFLANRQLHLNILKSC